jgi:hypothetical protein
MEEGNKNSLISMTKREGEIRPWAPSRRAGPVQAVRCSLGLRPGDPAFAHHLTPVRRHPVKRGRARPWPPQLRQRHDDVDAAVEKLTEEELPTTAPASTRGRPASRPLAIDQVGPCRATVEQPAGLGYEARLRHPEQRCGPPSSAAAGDPAAEPDEGRRGRCRCPRGGSGERQHHDADGDDRASTAPDHVGPDASTKLKEISGLVGPQVWPRPHCSHIL